MKRGAVASAVLHILVLLALIVVIPHAPPPAPPEEEFSVEFDGSSANAQKGEHPAKIAAAADADQPATDKPAPKPPTKAPTETAPPPPPPVETVAKPDTTPPPTPPTEAPTPTKAPPPPPEKPQPKPAEKPTVKTMTHQQHPTKAAVPDTHSLENTLEKFMADQKQVKPPTHVYNPERGGRKNGGGAKTGSLTGELSDGQRKQIGDEVRRCYSEDTAAKDYATYSAIMTVTIDATGEVRDAQLAASDAGRAAADPAFRAFAERAVRAVLDPACAKLPVPPDLLGKPAQTLTFRFRP